MIKSGNHKKLLKIFHYIKILKIFASNSSRSEKTPRDWTKMIGIRYYGLNRTWQSNERL